MTKIYSPEELNSFSRETLVAVILSMQDQLARLNTNMERLTSQIASANNHRYGRSSEKLVMSFSNWIGDRDPVVLSY